MDLSLPVPMTFGNDNQELQLGIHIEDTHLEQIEGISHVH
jgi:hypothetical protein